MTIINFGNYSCLLVSGCSITHYIFHYMSTHTILNFWPGAVFCSIWEKSDATAHKDILDNNPTVATVWGVHRARSTERAMQHHNIPKLNASFLTLFLLSLQIFRLTQHLLYKALGSDNWTQPRLPSLCLLLRNDEGVKVNFEWYLANETIYL